MPDKYIFLGYVFFSSLEVSLNYSSRRNFASMPQKFFCHTFKIGIKEYLIALPDYYDGNGGGGVSNIGSAMGISKIFPETEIDPDKYDTVTVSDGLKNGVLVRLRISYDDGTKNKSARIICPVDKAKVAICALLGKIYKGKIVVSAGIPRRRRLG